MYHTGNREMLNTYSIVSLLISTNRKTLYLEIEMSNACLKRRKNEIQIFIDNSNRN